MLTEQRGNPSCRDVIPYPYDSPAKQKKIKGGDLGHATSLKFSWLRPGELAGRCLDFGVVRDRDAHAAKS